MLYKDSCLHRHFRFLNVSLICNYWLSRIAACKLWLCVCLSRLCESVSSRPKKKLVDLSYQSSVATRSHTHLWSRWQLIFSSSLTSARSMSRDTQELRDLISRTNPRVTNAYFNGSDQNWQVLYVNTQRHNDQLMWPNCGGMTPTNAHETYIIICVSVTCYIWFQCVCIGFLNIS